MRRVTVIVETDEQYTKVSRERETDDLGILLAQCIYRVADTFNSRELEEIAKAAKSAIQRRR